MTLINQKEIIDLLDLIRRAQNKDGSFSHLSSPHRDFTKATTYRTTFFTALILECLCDVPHPNADWIKKQAADFLLRQFQQGTINYWPRNSREARISPYPDDLDDTMLALYALNKYDPYCLPVAVIMDTITVLTQLEVSLGGPYRTWITKMNNPQWQDIDCAVNANCAAFLYAMNVKNPALARYIRQVVETESFTSPYYPTAFPLYYYLSRTHVSGVTQKLRSMVLSKSNLAHTTLDKALVVLALINLSAPLSQIEPRIKDLLLSNDAAAPFCFDPTINSKPYYAGSKALTVAFRLSAIVRYTAAYKASERRNNQSQHEQRVLTQVRSLCPPTCMGNMLYSELINLNRDYASHKIVLTTIDFEQTLKQPTPLPAGSSPLLGAANLFGWYAYTIFDDVMDDTTNCQKLPLALRAHEMCFTIYKKVFGSSSSFYKYIEKIMQQTHHAMHHEIHTLRFSPIDGTSLPILQNGFPLCDLAHRSFGHFLGPLGIINSLLTRNQKKDFAELETFYTHLIITRQLLDDAHDWLADFKQGHLTLISYDICQALHISHYSASSEKEMTDYFWETYFPHFLGILDEHLDLCMRSSHKLCGQINSTYFESLIAPLRRQVQKSRLHHEQTQLVLRLRIFESQNGGKNKQSENNTNR